MKWMGRRESGNIDDQRGNGRGLAVGGGLTAVVAVVFALLTGQNPLEFIGMAQQGGTSSSSEQKDLSTDLQSDANAHFVATVLGDTEEVWDSIFTANQMRYEKPVLTLFTDQISSGCGAASSQTGPFYCPADSKVYIDLSFYNDLKERFGAPGDFAMAYVVAHEVGHHIQHLLGTTDRIDNMRGRLSESKLNEQSVRLELQADFYAGVWAHYIQKKTILEDGERKTVLEEGDFEEALNAANAIGDDRLQMEAQGHVVPDAFTHGTSAQRMKWFKKGFDTGDMSAGDTFSTSSL
ncbi:KPN_02809 family neutral zinc metallopeptidase [Arcticibacter eurypsychrophilus]|uniref:KPN_02809 family neutral zinc metallopeptidase n=1 Tax=Arcticibacter eurypsychrophilus TaxID=1434752 RepID=UPI00084DA2E8|nr:neutral zinc metallopeptidase [Arcticibacter eurypsychrophilus]